MRLASGSAILFLAALLLLTAASSASGFAVEQSRPGPSLPTLNRYLSSQIRSQGIPGLAIGVVHGSKVVETRGFGKADGSGRPVTPDTPFILASVSKTITALAVMQLVQAGKVRLESPVTRYLPWFRLADPAASKRITLRQLLNHTSGLPPTSCETEVRTLDRYVRDLRTVRPDRPVGSKHVYCSGNYDILGLIVQKVSGQDFSTYVERHIFFPLRMWHSFGREGQARRDGLAQGHAWFFGLVVPMNSYNPSDTPAGYLISSAGDMSHWLAAEMNGGSFQGVSVLSRARIEQMWRQSVATDQGYRYGLGWEIAKLGGIPAVYHYGDNYNFQSIAFMEPSAHWGAVILVNGNGLLASDTLRHIDADVARILAGRSPSGASGLSLPVLYLLVDAVLAILSILMLFSLFRLPRWRLGVEARRRDHRRWLARAVLRILLETVIAIALLLAVYEFFNTLGANSLNQVVRAVPDLVPWIMAFSAVLFLNAILHSLAAARVWRLDA